MVDLEKLRKRTSRFEKKYTPYEEGKHWGAWWSLGWRIALEWGSAVFVSYLIGDLMDGIFEITPWGVIGMLLLGNIAGLLNIYRAYKKNELESF